jgi:hypothetical protein
MCQVFRNDEPSYEAWVASHPRGWVFNNFGGGNPTYNKLHRLPCSAINRPSDRGRWTVVEKICCDDRACIEQTIGQRRGDVTTWETCGTGCTTR